LAEKEKLPINRIFIFLKIRFKKLASITYGKFHFINSYMCLLILFFVSAYLIVQNLTPEQYIQYGESHFKMLHTPVACKLFLFGISNLYDFDGTVVSRYTEKK